MTFSWGDLLADLNVETMAVTALVADLSVEEWDLATPAEGWAIRDQVSHLAFFDEAAVTAATDEQRFRREADELLDLGPGFPDVVAARYRSLPPEELTEWFTEARRRLIAVFSGLQPSDRVPWFGPPMSVASSATARLMETWAHGQDVADTLGAELPATSRLRHIAHLGVRTMGFSFVLRGREAPEIPVWVDLLAPDGDRWRWGDEHAPDAVLGSAVDFCRVVTQRRHLADTDLVVRGAVAAEWMAIAQAFAGAPGPGRPPRGRGSVRDAQEPS